MLSKILLTERPGDPYEYVSEVLFPMPDLQRSIGRAQEQEGQALRRLQSMRRSDVCSQRHRNPGSRTVNSSDRYDECLDEVDGIAEAFSKEVPEVRRELLDYGGIDLDELV